jgi:hypothetical protein
MIHAIGHEMPCARLCAVLISVEQLFIQPYVRRGVSVCALRCQQGTPRSSHGMHEYVSSVSDMVSDSARDLQVSESSRGEGPRGHTMERASELCQH